MHIYRQVDESSNVFEVESLPNTHLLDSDLYQELAGQESL